MVVALGIVSTITTSLAIDVYGSITENAGGAAKVVKKSHRICERRATLKVVGNTTPATGRGFAISSVSSVSLTPFGGIS